MLVVVYKKTDNVIHDVQFKEQKNIAKDDRILEGWSRVPTIEELNALQDPSYQKHLKQQHATDSVQNWLDSKARELGYDGILSAITYGDSSVTKFRSEGNSFLLWRDMVWQHCYRVLAEWEAGTSNIHTEEELLNSLPKFVISE